MLLSAIAGRAARRVFAADLTVVTTAYNIAEVEEYAPEFAARYGLDEELLRDTLWLLPMTVVPEGDYASSLPAAQKLMAERDDDDVELAALALHLRIPIWSNDRDYDRFPHGRYGTAQLLTILGV